MLKHTHKHTQRTTCSPVAEIHNTVGTEKDYYIKPKSTQRESTADPKWRERRAKPGAALLDKQRGGAGLQRARRSEGRISALLHDDLLDFILWAGACTADSAVSEYFSFGSSVYLLFTLLPHISSSLVSDLVKCSRTAAWRVCCSLSITLTTWFMLYILHIRSLSVIASQMCFVHALFFTFQFLKKKKKNRKRKKLGPRKKWVHYPANCTPQWLELTGILGCDPTVVNFHLSPIISHYVSTNAITVTRVDCRFLRS